MLHNQLLQIQIAVRRNTMETIGSAELGSVFYNVMNLLNEMNKRQSCESYTHLFGAGQDFDGLNLGMTCGFIWNVPSRRVSIH